MSDKRTQIIIHVNNLIFLPYGINTRISNIFLEMEYERRDKHFYHPSVNLVFLIIEVLQLVYFHDLQYPLFSDLYMEAHKVSQMFYRNVYDLRYNDEYISILNIPCKCLNSHHF